jgi:hypothetical protein
MGSEDLGAPPISIIEGEKEVNCYRNIVCELLVFIE